MSEGSAGLRRKLESADKLHSVVRAMKALAAANIGQFEKSVVALADYSRTVELGLSLCLRQNTSINLMMKKEKSPDDHNICAIVFGSDQGLVGHFNDTVGDFAVKTLQGLPGTFKIWAVGERVQLRSADASMSPVEYFPVPSSVRTISKLIGQILLAIDEEDENTELHLFYNQATSKASYTPTQNRILPLDDRWRSELVDIPWPTNLLPEIIGTTALPALIREYLFISLFRACAESLAAENASRLSAMQRADKNIQELVENLGQEFNHLRQSRIDEELFDVISGFETLSRRETA